MSPAVPIYGGCAPKEINTSVPGIPSYHLDGNVRTSTSTFETKVPTTTTTAGRNMTPCILVLTRSLRSTIVIFMPTKAAIDTTVTCTWEPERSRERFGKPVTSLTITTTLPMVVRRSIEPTLVTTSLQPVPVRTSLMVPELPSERTRSKRLSTRTVPL